MSDYCIRRRPKKEAVSASGTIAAALPGLGEMLGTRILASRCCVGCTKICKELGWAHSALRDCGGGRGGLGTGRPPDKAKAGEILGAEQVPAGRVWVV